MANSKTLPSCYSPYDPQSLILSAPDKRQELQQHADNYLIVVPNLLILNHGPCESPDNNFILPLNLHHCSDFDSWSFTCVGQVGWPTIYSIRFD